MTKPQPLDLNEKEIMKWIKQDIVVKKDIELYLRGTDERIVQLTINKIKNKIKSACDFYLRYKDNPELLIKEYNEFSEIVKRNNWDFLESKIDEYNEWLFKLAFKDVIGK